MNGGAPSPELVRATLRMRQNAEDRSKRKMMCAGYVKGPDCKVFFFPDEIREPVIVARGEIEEVGA